MARNYVVMALPGVFLYVQFDARKRWLQSLFYSYVSSQVQVFTTFTHVFTCYILIIKYDLGVFGAAMALNITYSLNFLLQEIYVMWYLWDELKFFSAPFCRRETFQEWCKFLKLGVPGTFQ